MKRLTLLPILYLIVGCAFAQTTYPLYTSSNSHYTDFWASNGTLSENQDNSIAESANKIVFDYTISGWWAGCGITIDYWTSNSTPDFNNYDTLLLTYKGIDVGSINFILQDRTGTNSDAFNLTSESSWTQLAIPLTNFTSTSSVDLSTITQILLFASGASSGSSSIELCHLELKSTAIGSPPSISITSPTNNATQSTKAHVPITVSTSDADGTVEEVDYYLNGQYFKTVKASPFTLNFFPQQNDSFEIEAVAIDDDKNETWSTPITYVVDYAGDFNVLSNERMGSACNGVNMSNFLEAEWDKAVPGFPDETQYPEHYLDTLQSMGVDVIRLPVIFEHFASYTYPYNLDTPHEIFDLVDSMILWTEERNMYLIIDNHHPEVILRDSNWESSALRSALIMQHVVEKYDYAQNWRVYFELRNEPKWATPIHVRKYYNQVIDSIRAVNNEHTIIIGCANYNRPKHLYNYGTYNDTNAVYTFHDYAPQYFTHQGFSWGTWPTTGITFNSSLPDFTAFEDMQRMRNWSDSLNVHIFMGEFGVSTYADETSRCQYMDSMTSIADSFEMPWIYWGWKSADAADEDFGWFLSNDISSDSIMPCMYAALNCTPEFNVYLPVEWLSFYARKNGSHVDLNWSTANENNNEGFYVERSNNGTDWKQIAFMSSKGYSSNVAHYSFLDMNPMRVNYYRIRQVDFDQNSSTSKIKKIVFDESSIDVYPNPSNGVFTINSEEDIIGLEVLTFDGKTVTQIDNPSSKLDLSKLPKAPYLVRFTTEEGIFSKRIILL